VATDRGMAIEKTGKNPDAGRWEFGWREEYVMLVI